VSADRSLGNNLLAALSAADFESLRPNLRPFNLKFEAVLVEAGGFIERVYFPQSGIISLVVRLPKGEAVEAAMVGRDGEFGAAAALDGQISPNTAIVSMEGKASTLEVAVLQVAAERSVSLRAMLIRHEQILFAQAIQSVACTASHRLQTRLSRWLLRARDLSDSDGLRFSQEFLARMLGSHPNSLSVVAHSLQRAGIIRYHRGQIEITNLERLKKSSCGCYEALKTHSDDLLHKGLASVLVYPAKPPDS